MPRPASILLLPQQSHNHDISALFNWNYIFERGLVSSFQHCLQAWLSINCSAPKSLPQHPYALGPSQSPGPRRDAGARPAAAKRGRPRSHWDRLGEQTQRGKGGFHREQGGLWWDTEGETTRLQVNLYPYSKNIQLGDPGGGPPRRERIWVHSQPSSWL